MLDSTGIHPNNARSKTRNGGIDTVCIEVCHILDLSRKALDGVSIRTFRPEDVSRLSVIANNRSISDQFVGFPHPYSLSEAESWISLPHSETSVRIAMEYLGELVGGMCVDFNRRENGTIWGTLSFWLSPEYWKKGIVDRSKRLLLDRVFENPSVNGMMAHVFETNTRSINSLTASGFIPIQSGIEVFRGDNAVKESIYGLTRDRYEKWSYLRDSSNKIRNAFINHEDFVSDFLGNRKGEYSLQLKTGKEIFLRSRNEEVSDIDIAAEIFVNGDYNLSPLRDLESPTIIDVGAQIGLFSAHAANVLRTPRIISFEPCPENFSILLRNAENFGMTVHKKAVTANTGEIKLFLSGSNVGGHSIIPSKDDEGISVACISFADLLDQNGIDRIDLLKMDCEGAEYEIIFGMDPSILRKIDRIYMEVHWNYEIAKRYGKFDMVRFLESSGFKVNIQKEFSYEGEGEFYVIFCERTK